MFLIDLVIKNNGIKPFIAKDKKKAESDDSAFQYNLKLN